MYAHYDDLDTPPEVSLAALDELVKEGKAATWRPPTSPPSASTRRSRRPSARASRVRCSSRTTTCSSAGTSRRWSRSQRHGCDGAVLRARQGVPRPASTGRATRSQPACRRSAIETDRGWPSGCRRRSPARRARRRGRAGWLARSRRRHADRERAQHRAARGSCRWPGWSQRRRAREADGAGACSRFAEPQDPVFRELNTRSASTAASGRTTCVSRAPTRGCSPAPGSSPAPTATRCSPALDEVEAELDGGALRVPRPTTRTSTWRSSGGSPSSPGRSAGKLHTARSRNDQVATDVALFTRDARRRRGRGHARRCMRALVDVAERHIDWPMPGYTHLQRAQPVYLVAPPAGVRLDARPRPRALPLRRRADRDAAARRGRARGRELRRPTAAWSPPSSASPASRRTRSTPSPTATSSSTTSAPPRPARRTSPASARSSSCGRARSSASSSCPTPGSSGSSIMPQKKNPDAAELLRAKAPRIVGAPRRAARRHARPPADLQQGHAGGQGAPLRRRRHARAEPRRGARDARGGALPPRAPRRRRRPTSSSPPPTSPTCSCARASRSARPTASWPGLVRARRRLGPPAVATSRRDELRAALRGSSTPRSRRCSTQRSWLESKVSRGRTALDRVREQLAAARAALDGRSPREALAAPSTTGRCSRSRATSSAARCATARPPA